MKKQCSATGKTTHCISTRNALHWAMEGTALSRTKAESLHDNESTYYGKTRNGRTRSRSVSDCPEDEWPAGAVRRRPSAWTARSQISLFQPPHSCAERHEALWAVSLLYASLPALRCVLLPFASDWRHGHATEIFLWLIHPSGMLLLPIASFLTRSGLVHFIRIREINA